MTQVLKRALELVAEEYSRAVAAHAPMHSAHEGKAVIEEELDELWDEIKKRRPDLATLQKEAVQVAAMAVRFLTDVCKVGRHPIGCMCVECEEEQMLKDVEQQRMAAEVDRDLGIEPTYRDYARTRTRKATGLEAAGRCYACGADIRRLARSGGEPRYYCSLRCMRCRPPKMAVAEQHWGKPFAELALEHLNAGRSINALAELCGVHRQAVYAWLRIAGVRQRVVWEKGGIEPAGRVPG